MVVGILFLSPVGVWEKKIKWRVYWGDFKVYLWGPTNQDIEEFFRGVLRKYQVAV